MGWFFLILIIIIVFFLILLPVADKTFKIVRLEQKEDRLTVHATRYLLFWKSSFTYHIIDNVVYCDYGEHGVSKAHKELADHIKEKVDIFKKFGK